MIRCHPPKRIETSVHKLLEPSFPIFACVRSRASEAMFSSLTVLVSRKKACNLLCPFTPFTCQSQENALLIDPVHAETVTQSREYHGQLSLEPLCRSGTFQPFLRDLPATTFLDLLSFNLTIGFFKPVVLGNPWFAPRIPCFRHSLGTSTTNRALHSLFVAV